MLKSNCHGDLGGRGSSTRWVVHPKYCPGCGTGQPVSDRCVLCGAPLSTAAANGGDAGQDQELESTDTPSAKPAGETADTPVNAIAAVFGRMSSRSRVLAFSIMFVFIGSIIVGTAHYRRHRQGHYMQNYVLAIYGIKSGMDITARLLEGARPDGKAGESGGATEKVGDTPSKEDLAVVKSEVRKIIEGMGPPPAGCEQSAESLKKLYSIYERIDSTAIDSHSTSLDNTRISSEREGFSREINALKECLPAPLAAEFKKAGGKYDLRFMGF